MQAAQGARAGKLLHSLPLVPTHDFSSISVFFLVPRKIILNGYIAVLEPTCAFLEPNLAPKTDPNSMVFGLQETTYVARAENVKNCTTLKRKPCFCLPRTPKKHPKLDNKSVSRVFYVEVFF